METPDKLNEFAKDEHMMAAVYNQIGITLNSIALQKVFAKVDTSAIPEAKEIIDKAFTDIKEMYTPNKRKADPPSPR